MNRTSHECTPLVHYAITSLFLFLPATCTNSISAPLRSLCYWLYFNNNTCRLLDENGNGVTQNIGNQHKNEFDRILLMPDALRKQQKQQPRLCDPWTSRDTRWERPDGDPDFSSNGSSIWIHSHETRWMVSLLFFPFCCKSFAESGFPTHAAT